MGAPISGGVWAYKYIMNDSASKMRTNVLVARNRGSLWRLSGARSRKIRARRLAQ